MFLAVLAADDGALVGIEADGQALDLLLAPVEDERARGVGEAHDLGPALDDVKARKRRRLEAPVLEREERPPLCY